MATEVVRDLADTIIGHTDTVEAEEAGLENNPSAATVRTVENNPYASYEKCDTEEASRYTLTCESGYSRDVERWMRGDVSLARTPAFAPAPERDSGPAPQQLEITDSVYRTLWYWVAAVALPFTSLGNTLPPHWIAWCQESEAAGREWFKNILTLLRFDVFLAKLAAALSIASGLCAQLQCRARRADLREVFAAAVDAVLLAYAAGFLLLSLCQASLISF